MIYLAKFKFVTNMTLTGDYEQIEVIYLYKGNSFCDTESNLKEIIRKNHAPKQEPVALSISIVSYDKIILLAQPEIKINNDYKFYEIVVEFQATIVSKGLVKKRKKYLFQHYTMDEAKKKCLEVAKTENDILYDDFHIAKVVETSIFDAYIS